MLHRKAPLQSGTDTEIDLIEREMEGGVIVEQPLEVEERHVETRLEGEMDLKGREGPRD